MRAAAFAPEVARLLGVRVGRMLTLGWALAAVAGSLAGVLVAPSVFLGPNSFDPILISGFVAAVLGGLDSPPGAVIGGLVLGLGAVLRVRLRGLGAGAAGRARDPRGGADGAPDRTVLRHQGAARMSPQQRALGSARRCALSGGGPRRGRARPDHRVGQRLPRPSARHRRLLLRRPGRADRAWPG